MVGNIFRACLVGRSAGKQASTDTTTLNARVMSGVFTAGTEIVKVDGEIQYMRRVIITDCITEMSLRDAKIYGSIREVHEDISKITIRHFHLKAFRSLESRKLSCSPSLHEGSLFLELYPVCWKTSSTELVLAAGWDGMVVFRAYTYTYSGYCWSISHSIPSTYVHDELEWGICVVCRVLVFCLCFVVVVVILSFCECYHSHPPCFCSSSVRRPFLLLPPPPF